MLNILAQSYFSIGRKVCMDMRCQMDDDAGYYGMERVKLAS